jgi:hypothetical protein
MKLTPLLQDQIVAYIRAGAYPHMAAEACGVLQEQFVAWVELGLKQKKGKYRSFVCEVRKAHAQARITAELAVFNEHPRDWLKHGPGKPKEGSVGFVDSDLPPQKK